MSIIRSGSGENSRTRLASGASAAMIPVETAELGQHHEHQLHRFWPKCLTPPNHFAELVQLLRSRRQRACLMSMFFAPHTRKSINFTIEPQPYDHRTLNPNPQTLYPEQNALNLTPRTPGAKPDSLWLGSFIPWVIDGRFSGVLRGRRERVFSIQPWSGRVQGEVRMY